LGDKPFERRVLYPEIFHIELLEEFLHKGGYPFVRDIQNDLSICKLLKKREPLREIARERGTKLKDNSFFFAVWLKELFQASIVEKFPFVDQEDSRADT
jgi:hypothetical protein